MALLLSQSYLVDGCVLGNEIFPGLELRYAEHISGAIFGTGTNGAYFENLSKITKLRNYASEGPNSKMMINTEWGAFDPSVRISKLSVFDSP